ncbi:D-amino-acid oxidase [Olea europaea subsp. europaea]|uniref:D-amino-acid oxidase n=1 Tax=Olea europaea subsp. europaea TaxID=158383 RepID=A0A8S0PXZ2_OLEEU|nr:D-amino-acid oxidase [Olea europaea subsp. europaea]
MASSKTLIRTGVSLINRFVNPTVNSNPIPIHRILCQSPPLINPPQLFPSHFLPQSHTSFLQFPQNQNDAESRRELFLHPSGIPFLPFFLPEGDDSSSSKSMILLPKRTYQPSNIRRKRTHGFFARNERWPESYCSANRKRSVQNHGLRTLDCRQVLVKSPHPLWVVLTLHNVRLG